MQATSEQTRAFQELFERFSSEMTAKHRHAFERYIDFLKDLVEQHQRCLSEEASRCEDPFSNFAKMMMASYMRMLSFHREYRSFSFGVEASLAEMQLRWLDLVKETLHREPFNARE
jgi:hypothetical protein